MINFLYQITPEQWSAGIATLAALYALIFQGIEWSRNRFLKGVDLIDKLYDQFDSSQFRLIRRKTAAYLLSDKKSAPYPKEIGRLLDFFESIAYLRKKKIFTDELVWHYFATWLLPYVASSIHIIIERQSKDKTVYEDLMDLNLGVLKIEASKHKDKNTSHITSPEEITAFLEDEKNA